MRAVIRHALFEDLANAARKIYIDLGVSIDFKTMDLSARQTPPKIAAYCALGRITYPGSFNEGDSLHQAWISRE